MEYEPRFKDREAAGEELARHLEEFTGRKDVVVLALPRGGVPVGYEVARHLGAPLDVFIVRKLGVPGQEELAFGALASGGVVVFNEGILRVLRMPEELLQAVMEREQRELERREQLYRERRRPLDIKDKTVIVVDDGLATGATMAAAIEALQQMGPTEIVVAAPVSSEQACAELRTFTNTLCVSVAMPEPFYGVGIWYEDFSQTTDKEVKELLAERNDAFKLQAKANSL
jgi:putative phosphoribosyl transferase